MSHAQIRNSIERLFGLWKRRFPVIAVGLRTKLTTTLAVIIATGVLHNIARMRRVMLVGDDPEPQIQVDNNHNARKIWSAANKKVGVTWRIPILCVTRADMVSEIIRCQTFSDLAALYALKAHKVDKIRKNKKGLPLNG